MKTTRLFSDRALPFGPIARGWAALRASWFWEAVLVPFVFTRLAWILTAALARGTFQPNPTYLRYYQQGGVHTRIFLLDIFAHWDAKFYLSIIEGGYQATQDFANSYSNSAFLPLYPYLVKSIGWLGVRLPTGAYLLIGIVLSNLCFLVAMLLLRRIAVGQLGFSEAALRRAILLLMVFPASFFFSSFYTESLFLMLTLLAFCAALERRWGLAGLAAALVVLTRVQGLIVFGVLGLMYLQSREWRIQRIRADVLWFALAPALLAAHLFHIGQVTGTPLAPLLAQQAWNRNQYSLIDGLRLQLEAPVLDVYKIDGVMVLFYLGCGLFLLLARRSRLPWLFGVYVVLMCIIPVATGMLISATRYVVVVFPVFLLLGEQQGRRSWIHLLAVLWFTLQIVYFAGWATYYWVA